MLLPKHNTLKNKTIDPNIPKVLLNASAVNVTPSLDEDSQTPVVSINKAVKVHMINVSNIGPIIATNPCLTGCDVFAAPCIIASVPMPASLLNAPLLTPVIMTPPKRPPLTAVLLLKASEKINPKDGRNWS